MSGGQIKIKLKDGPIKPLHVNTPIPDWFGCAILAKIMDTLRNLDLTGNLALVPKTQTHATFTFMLYEASETHKGVVTW